MNLTDSNLGTILVIDDQEIILEVARIMLDELGFATVTAHSGEELETLLTSNDRLTFSAAIIDLSLEPGMMPGLETAVMLKKLRPDVRIFISTGSTHDSIFTDFKKHGFCGVLKKPFKIATLFDLLSPHSG